MVVLFYILAYLGYLIYEGKCNALCFAVYLNVGSGSVLRQIAVYGSDLLDEIENDVLKQHSDTVPEGVCTVRAVSEIARKDNDLEFIDNVDDGIAVGVVVGFYLINSFSAGVAGDNIFGNRVKSCQKIAVHMLLPSIIHHKYYIPE